VRKTSSFSQVACDPYSLHPINDKHGSQATRLNAGRFNRRGFSAVELLVVVGILVILISIFVPYVLRIRETDHRAKCADNLRQLSTALNQYANSNKGDYPRVVYDLAKHPMGYTCFTGPDDGNPFVKTPDGYSQDVQPSDVTASLWLLVRMKFASPKDFVCPSTNDSVNQAEDETGHPVAPSVRGNFREPSNLSYSYASPFSPALDYQLNDTEKADFAVMADKNPGDAGAQSNAIGPSFNAPPLALAIANSNNHGKAGQNVLYADGHVDFTSTPYCGVQQDNIYSALRATPLAIGETPPANGNGVIGRNYSPAWPSDSYLVPTATDTPTPPAMIITTQATSEPSTRTNAPTLPATRAVTLPTTIPSTGPTTTTAPTTNP
jgi:prepilin-type N-terminal cleavage/methylation domain-containing protein/prepilin-type processing-associated H-X9-DG protein